MGSFFPKVVEEFAAGLSGMTDGHRAAKVAPRAPLATFNPGRVRRWRSTGWNPDRLPPLISGAVSCEC